MQDYKYNAMMIDFILCVFITNFFFVIMQIAIWKIGTKKEGCGVGDSRLFRIKKSIIKLGCSFFR